MGAIPTDWMRAFRAVRGRRSGTDARRGHAAMPRDPAPESTIRVLREGYRYVTNRCEELGSDVFEARILLRRTICMRGAEAARLFYDEERFRRRGAAPRRVRKTLFGEGGVQGLDGVVHRARKAAFLSLMTPEGITRLEDGVAAQWEASMRDWETAPRVVLSREVERIFCRAVCEWAGVPLPAREVDRRTRELVALFESPAAIGPRYWRGRIARRRSDAWLARLVEQVRAGRRDAPAGGALRTFAEYREPDGTRLPARVAAVELLNVLRPTVAVSRFVTFGALALHDHPETRAALLHGGGNATERFVQEVRRYYPFFPAVAARVRRTFTWNGLRFPKGRRVLLDLYGTNHDPRIWPQPEVFRPERFETWDGSPYTLIPQGAGDHQAGHRCAGEWLTIALTKTAVEMLTRRMTYRVPPQDLSVRLSRMPAAPASGFVVTDVRAAARRERRLEVSPPP